MKYFSLAVIAVATLMASDPVAIAADPLFPSWSKQLTTTRFTVLQEFNNAAVLDNETGLVWERTPSKTALHWQDAVDYCFRLVVGNRMGWRLPTIEELASLVDPSSTDVRKLPKGHPFLGYLDDYKWSSTINPTFTNGGGAWHVIFSGPNRINASFQGNKGYPWCVRGGQGFSGYNGLRN